MKESGLNEGVGEGKLWAEVCGKCVCSVVVNRGQQTTTTNLEEIIWSSSGDVWFTATRGGIELEAKKSERCR